MNTLYSDGDKFEVMASTTASKLVELYLSFDTTRAGLTLALVKSEKEKFIKIISL